jgi:hypothetical protein
MKILHAYWGWIAIFIADVEGSDYLTHPAGFRMRAWNDKSLFGVQIVYPVRLGIEAGQACDITQDSSLTFCVFIDQHPSSSLLTAIPFRHEITFASSFPTCVHISGSPMVAPFVNHFKSNEAKFLHLMNDMSQRTRMSSSLQS